MLYKIHNPRPATQGIWVSGQRVMVRSGTGLILELGEDDAAAARKRVTLEAIGQEPDPVQVVATDAFVERIAQVEFQEIEPAITNGQSLDLAFLSDDELRAMCKTKGIKVHHKAGRAKLLDALA